MRLAALTLVFCLGVLTLTGCATRSPIRMHKNEKKPDLGLVSQVEIGDTIYTDFDYIQTEGVRLTNGFKYTYGRFDRVKINIEPDAFLTGYQYSNGKKEYCTVNGDFNVCFLNNRDDGHFDRFRVIASYETKQNWMHTDHDVPFEKSATGDIKGRKTELLYDGIENGSLKITYREYIDSAARPDFYQQVNYELSPNGTTTIGFKGAQIEVLGTSNNQMTYKVIKGFRDR
jgi:hypothetical protein